MNFERIMAIMWNTIRAYEDELEQQDYETAEELHNVVLNELSMTEQEYLEVMGRKYQW